MKRMLRGFVESLSGDYVRFKLLLPGGLGDTRIVERSKILPPDCEILPKSEIEADYEIAHSLVGNVRVLTEIRMVSVRGNAKREKEIEG